jgi:hypothetical protein
VYLPRDFPHILREMPQSRACLAGAAGGLQPGIGRQQNLRRRLRTR